MPKQSQISILKLLIRYPFQRSTKPNFPFFPKPITQLSTNPLIPNINPIFPINPLRKNLHSCPNYSTESRNDSVSPALDVNKEVDMINMKFAQAREEIEMAMESKETVYFNEEAECARDAVKEVLDMFNGLLRLVSESEKAALQRSMGLKIEQLKAELQQLDD